MTDKTKKKPWDAVQYLYDHYVNGDPEMEDLIEKAKIAGNIAQKIYDIRTQMGYSHKQIAKKIGTSTSTISMLEDADYGALSMQTLKHIAETLEQLEDNKDMENLLKIYEKEIKHIGDKKSRKSKKSRY